MAAWHERERALKAIKTALTEKDRQVLKHVFFPVLYSPVKREKK